MKTKIKLLQVQLLCAAALGIASPLSFAATFTDTNWISLGGFPGANGPVYAAAADASGNVYIAGNFTLVGNTSANRIAKWDGSSWSALGSGLDTPVYALAVSGGDLYAGGQFSTAGGSPAKSIAKWDGSSWSALGSGMSSDYYPSVYALAVSGSNVYAGGDFTRAGGIVASNIAKWDGSSWSSLGSGIGNTPYAYVYALVVSGSTVYAGGYFTTADGNPANYVAKWDGVGWSALGPGMDNQVSALAVSGSDLYAGGQFTMASGVATNCIAKWDGIGWTALGSGISGSVSSLAVSDSDLYAGGSFTTPGSIAATNIAKWDGSTWTAVGSGVNGTVSALALSGSSVYAGGGFTMAGAGVAQSIAKWDGNGWTLPRSEMLAMNGAVQALAMSGIYVYAGGNFTSAGGSNANLIAKWDGSSWSPLGSGMTGITDGGHILNFPGLPYVSALAASGTNIYAGGHFTNAGGIAANYIAQWNGSGWSALGSGMDGGLYVFGDFYPPYVSALAVSGSNLYAGGWFMTAGGNQVNNVAKWNGSTWSALGSGIGSGVFGDSSKVNTLAVSGNDVYVGGDFTMAGGISANSVAKWDGSSWSTLGSGVGPTTFPNGTVSALAVSGSNVYAGGSFTNAGGIAATNIAKWNGTTWTNLGSGMNNTVSALAVSGGNVYAGGSYTNADGSPANSIARWDGTTWSALGSGVGGPYSGMVGRYPTVYALALSGSDFYVGGDFWTAGAKTSAYVARAIVNPPVLAIDPDGYGGFFLRFSGVPGSEYRLQRAQVLTGPWANSSFQIAPSSGHLEFWDVFPPPAQAFYRTVGP